MPQSSGLGARKLNIRTSPMGRRKQGGGSTARQIGSGVGFRQIGTATAAAALAAVAILAAAWLSSGSGSCSAGTTLNWVADGWQQALADPKTMAAARLQFRRYAEEHGIYGPTCMTEGGPAKPTAPDTDRISQLVDAAAPASAPWPATVPGDYLATGKAIAKALNLRKLMSDIVDNSPNSSFVALDPPIIRFDDFMSAEECNAMIEAGKRFSMKKSKEGTKDQNLNRLETDSRTSQTSWCYHDPACTKIDSRISNITGFSYQNNENFQVLHYEQGQEYQVHSDFIFGEETGGPGRVPTAGNRIFTFFLYLNDVDPDAASGGPPWNSGSKVDVESEDGWERGAEILGPAESGDLEQRRVKFPDGVIDDWDVADFRPHHVGGGTTWFPQAQIDADHTYSWTTDEDVTKLFEYYDRYNDRKQRRKMEPASKRFPDVGYRSIPRRGTAIMWPNVHLDNVFAMHPRALHASDELAAGHVKWAANAWIHLRDYRTPVAVGSAVSALGISPDELRKYQK